MMYEMKREEYKKHTIIISEDDYGDVQWEIYKGKKFIKMDSGHSDWDMAEDAAKERIDKIARKKA